jgi:hypothetical protein
MARKKKAEFTTDGREIIMLVNPEVHADCFTELSRRGTEVVCEECGVVATTTGYYQNANEGVVYNSRKFSRGHSRGRHKQ